MFRTWPQIDILILTIITTAHSWLPDTSSKIFNEIGQLRTIKFSGNLSYPDHFIVLNQDEQSILLGARNAVYNLSISDFAERKESRIDWPSSDAHSQLCILKGKSEDECQNYIRILVNTTQTGVYQICGTNSYKPYCRHYSIIHGKYRVEKELDGIGVCPYNPEHNSTAVYSNDQLYSATVADFSGGDPLIYREPQRTELSDLKQLNAPNFVSSVPYGNYVFFFYRETAVEYINCGKVIYSRVARVCKDDKGGPHQFRDRWTSFLKSRLNCSVPGEYPFYFDEIQSTSDIIQGKYGYEDLTTNHVIYGILTTSSNAIAGSAICVYNMRDILETFESPFKSQEGINANWLPVSKNKVPDPRPGQCVPDSRILPENNVNFVKTHSLMEKSVPAFFGKPILIRVSLQYRFTAIAVQPQVRSVSEGPFDVIYVGTDNGKVLKIVNIAASSTTTTTTNSTTGGANNAAIVISENVLLPGGAPVRQLRIVPGRHGSVVVVGRDEASLATLNHCSMKKFCGECVQIQDPHCAWDLKTDVCISLDDSSTITGTGGSLIQDVLHGDNRKCYSSPSPSPQHDGGGPVSDDRGGSSIIENDIIHSTVHEDLRLRTDLDSSLRGAKTRIDLAECVGAEDSINCAIRHRLVIYTAETLHLFVFLAAILFLIVGFVAGYLFSQKFHTHAQYTDAPPFIEQHNHLERLSGTQSNFLSPRPNKSVNLNSPVNAPPVKKDNLDTSSKDLNIASDGTLQKIKKTYI